MRAPPAFSGRTKEKETQTSLLKLQLPQPGQVIETNLNKVKNDTGRLGLCRAAEVMKTIQKKMPWQWLDTPRDFSNFLLPLSAKLKAFETSFPSRHTFKYVVVLKVTHRLQNDEDNDDDHNNDEDVSSPPPLHCEPNMFGALLSSMKSFWVVRFLPQRTRPQEPR